MLLLIGLGLATKDLSARALEEIKDADELLLETYTAFLPDDYIVFLEKQTGKKPKLIKRRELEEEVKETVAKAKEKKIAILIPGDPLIATTHSIILNEAKKQGIEYQVVHAPSVFSIAIGDSGLDVYKFGPTVTIPFWSDKYKPTSFIDAIGKNLQNEQHTLILLDIDQKNNRPMKLSEALEIIKMAQSATNSKILGPDMKIIVMANLGRTDKIVKYINIGGADQKLFKELEGMQLSLIVPGQMSFAEKESLQRATS
jgi:diphthine synthase